MKDVEFYIKHIKINGLFNLKNIDWNLNKDVNILGGINGSGKSTVINLLRAFLDYDNMEDEGNSSFLLEKIDSAEITFNDESKFYYKKDIIEDEYIFAKIGEKYANSSIGEPRSIFKLGHDPSSKKAIMGSYFFDNEINLSSICFYLSSAEHQIVSENVIKGIGNSNIKTTLDLSLYKEIRKRNELVTNASLRNATSLALIQHSNNLLIDSLNDYFADTNKSLKKDTSTFDVTTSNGNVISCYNLSTGEKQLLLIFLIAFNTNEEPCILLMDEPDLGIHIDWKKKLIKSIKDINPKAQLILSTHSPSMIGGWFDCVKEMNEISTNV